MAFMSVSTRNHMCGLLVNCIILVSGCYLRMYDLK